MGWPDTSPRLLSGWQLPAGLAGASLLPEFPWRLLPDLWGWLAGMLDVIAVGAIVSQSLVGSETLGLTLAWLLVGVLTYQYTPWLYPNTFKEVVSPVGFRALTAAGTLYFGLLVWGQILPEVVPGSVLATNTGPSEFFILSIFTSLLVWFVVFGLYFARWYSDPLGAEDSDLIIAVDSFSLGDLMSDREGDLPNQWQWFANLNRVSPALMLPTVVCVTVGLIAVVLNLFYPLPEAVLFTGLVVSRLLPEDAFFTSGTPHHEVDLRILDSASGATQNLKGAVMLISTLTGMFISGGIFLVYSGVVLDVISTTGVAGAVGIVATFDAVMMMVAILLMGIYSLIHWVRQLERIGPYARLWEADTDELTELRQLARPPGLLVPTFLPVIAMGVGEFLATVTSQQVALGMKMGILIVALVTMGWGLMWAWRHPPQPLTNESRDLLVTLLIQFGLYAVLFAIIDWETMQLRTEQIMPTVLVLSGLICAWYIPDGFKWGSQQEGVRALIGDVPMVLMALILILFVSLTLEHATLVVGLLLVLLGLFILVGVVGVYLERYIDEE